MKYVKFSGGFHNCPAIRVRVTERQYAELKEGFYSLEQVLSACQMKRLDRHFCGMKDCCCGGACRADMEL